MGLEGKILTILEPTLELDKYKFDSEGEQDGDNPGEHNTTRDMGVEFPLIIINGYTFMQNDVRSFEISNEGLVPTISLSIVDNSANFNVESFPRDGDVITVRLAARAKNDYKDIRIDFDGVNDQTGVIYSLEFMSIPEMKNIPVVIDNTLQVENNTKSTDIEYPKSECVITLFDILGSILHEITFYGGPTQRDQTKQKIIDNIDSDNLLDVLKLQLDEAVKSENYEEAAELRNLIEKYKNMGNKG